MGTKPTTAPENSLTISRVMKAPRSKVWKAWSTPEHLVKWWAPAPVVTTLQNFDLQPGGAFDSTMVMNGETIHAGKGCFLEVIAQTRVVFTDALEAGFKPSKNPFFTAIITFADHPEGTLYTATVVHKNEEDSQKHAEMGFVHGWGLVAEQLEAFAMQL